MATRRIIYNKNFEGSPFRTLGGKLSGGQKAKKRGISIPKPPTFTVSIHPDYAKWIPLSPQWQALQQWLIPGAATPKSHAQSWRRFLKSLKTTNWTEFLFEDTVFDSNFWKAFDLSDTTGMTATERYYETARIAGIKNPPPPQYGGAGDDIRRELWDMFNSPTYWDLDPNND